MKIENLKLEITGKISAVAIPHGVTGTGGLEKSVMSKLLASHQKGRAGRPCHRGKFDVRGLISRRLEQKRAFFGPFLTPNHLDFSALTEENGQKIFLEKAIGRGREMKGIVIGPASSHAVRRRAQVDTAPKNGPHPLYPPPATGWGTFYNARYPRLRSPSRSPGAILLRPLQGLHAVALRARSRNGGSVKLQPVGGFSQIRT